MGIYHKKSAPCANNLSLAGWERARMIAFSHQFAFNYCHSPSKSNCTGERTKNRARTTTVGIWLREWRSAISAPDPPCKICRLTADAAAFCPATREKVGDVVSRVDLRRRTDKMQTMKILEMDFLQSGWIYFGRTQKLAFLPFLPFSVLFREWHGSQVYSKMKWSASIKFLCFFSPLYFITLNSNFFIIFVVFFLNIQLNFNSSDL